MAAGENLWTQAIKAFAAQGAHAKNGTNQIN
jgi:hypothetical protein